MATFDRRREDVGNILQLEHVNLTVPDQGRAALFYVTGLGFTRDPYMDFGTRNMWINLGEQQLHLPLGDPQVFRGHLDVAMPDLGDLERRLDRLAKAMSGTRFAWARRDDVIHVTCPWGNDIRVHGPEVFARMSLGLPRVTVSVAAGTTAGIARFYRDIVGCPVTEAADSVDVRVGHNQTLRFAETAAQLAPYDGHHIAIYVADFSGPHQRLLERGLITEESDPVQYRFQHIVDPTSGAVLTELEHEVRALGHPMYRRNLVNRNPVVGFMNYRQGKEIFVPP